MVRWSLEVEDVTDELYIFLRHPTSSDRPLRVSWSRQKAFLFGLTAARTSRQINSLTSLASLFQNAMYGIVYA